jgi:hypothetical protein
MASVGAQGGDQILNEISQDWPTDMIIIYVETPNKFDMSYGTNITDKAVLDEMSAIEELMNPNKDDKGEEDNIAWVLSISTLIKEINEAPGNVWDASVDELDPVVDPGPYPGDSEYAIPDNQEDIDQIVEGIPEDTKELLVMDTNNDPNIPIWDSAWILLAVHKNANQEKVMNRIDNLMEKYYVDPQASESDFNSRHEWWIRIEAGAIHCQMTNLDYVDSYETHYGPAYNLETIFPLMVLVTICVLATITILLLFSRSRKGKGKGRSKKNFIIAFLIFTILIGANVLLVQIDTFDKDMDKFNDFSNEFNGGQMGLIVVLGSPAPPDDEPFIGSGSMKDIEVLDDIERFERDLDDLQDPENFDEGLNSPLTIIDIMKMIKVPESTKNQILMDAIPDYLQPRMDEILNSSFWDAIHTAGQIDDILWYARYSKSLQDTLINIFYKSITPELRHTFVNEDYSRSLLYFHLPMRERDQSEHLEDAINKVASNHSQFISVSNVALVSSLSGAFGSLSFIVKVTVLFFILLIGILFSILFSLKIMDLDKKKKENGEIVEVEEEAIFEDITDEEDPYHDDHPDLGPPQPPPYRP